MKDKKLFFLCAVLLVCLWAQYGHFFALFLSQKFHLFIFDSRVSAVMDFLSVILSSAGFAAAAVAGVQLLPYIFYRMAQFAVFVWRVIVFIWRLLVGSPIVSMFINVLIYWYNTHVLKWLEDFYRWIRKFF